MENRPDRAESRAHRFGEHPLQIRARGLMLACVLVLCHSSSTLAAPADNKSEPSALEQRYQERATANPKDTEALEGLATLRLKRGDFTGSIDAYRELLALVPNNRDAQFGLGRALAYHGQYAQAVDQYRTLLAENPHDADAMEAMAQAHLWSGHPEWSLPIFARLVAIYPANADYQLGRARALVRLHDYANARRTLSAILKAHPNQRDAELQLADLDIYQGRQESARRRFNQILRADPTDREALEGNARLAYYHGDLAYAKKLTTRLVDDNPRDTSSLLLLARVERGLHHLTRARELVGYTERIDPGNADARDLENSLNQETGYTFHTSASYAHEVTTGSPTDAENLTTYGFENTWSGYLLPRSQSFVSLHYLPSESPSGGIQGSVAPWQILFRQTTYFTPRLTLRYGAGMVRYGPESSVAIPSQTDNIISAGFRPIGFADFNYAFNPKLRFDFGLARNAITYTPVATHLGVVEDRVSLGLDFHPSNRSSFSMESYANQDSSIRYGHDFELISPTTTIAGFADRVQGLGTTFRLDHRFIQRQAVTIDLGYDGLVFAYTGNSLPYLGFFEPTFYQRHYLTSRLGLKLRGPVGFEFYSGEGFQQIERGTRITPAFLLSPSFTIRASERLKLSIGYSHYNNAESLGTLRGDAFHLTTDWRF